MTSELNEQRAAAARLAIQAAREDLLAFVILMEPGFSVAPHHRLICDELMKIESGENDRLMIFVSPRSSKSLISSRYFGAWSLGRNPKWQWMQISHSSDLATTFGREVRDVVNDPMYTAIFPGIKIRSDNRAADSWQLQQGGKFMGAGAGTKIAGFGGHVIVVDDPISEQDAWSNARRSYINNWYPGGLRTRLMPNGRMVIIQTRWHLEDLSGHLMETARKDEMADQWKIIDIPALNSEDSAEMLEGAADKLIDQGWLPDEYAELKKDESFWPEPAEEDGYYWGTKALLATRASMPPFQWAALYLQNPVSDAGGILKDSYWQDWDIDIRGKPPACEYIIQSYDTAFGTGQQNDYTARTTWGIFTDDNNIPNMILLGAEKDRWDFPSLRQYALDQYLEVEPDMVIVEKKASGQSLIQELRSQGIPIYEFNPERDKIARAHSASNLFAAKRVWVPKSRQWAQEVMTECAEFPAGAHDDYVDSVTQAVLWLRNGGWVPHPKDSWYDSYVEEKRGNYHKEDRIYY